MRPDRPLRLVASAALAGALVAGTLGGATSAAGASTRAADARLLSTGAAGSGTVVTRNVTMNVAFGMGPRRQRRDILRSTHDADVIGWQEINRDAQLAAIDNLEGWETRWFGGRRPDGSVWRHPRNTNPISWRTDTWTFERRMQWLASREIRNVVRDRYLTAVVLRHNETGERVLRWNIHFVPNAMNSSRVRKKAARRKAWRQQARTVQRFVDKYRDAGYAAIIGGGDINWRASFAGQRLSYDTDHQRIDYLTHAWSPRVSASEPGFTPMNSDHDKVRVDYTITP